MNPVDPSSERHRHHGAQPGAATGPQATAQREYSWRRPLGRAAAAVAVVMAGLAALAVPVLMLAGAPRGEAAFGGEVAVRGQLSSATLDVVAGDRTTPITVGALAPGDRVSGAIEVINAGSLPLRYALVVEPSGTLAEQWLRWTLWPAPSGQGCGPGPGNAGALAAAVVLDGSGSITVFGNPETGPDQGDRNLAAGQSELLCLQVTLPLDAPDAAQGNPVAPLFMIQAEHALPEPPP